MRETGPAEKPRTIQLRIWCLFGFNEFLIEVGHRESASVETAYLGFIWEIERWRKSRGEVNSGEVHLCSWQIRTGSNTNRNRYLNTQRCHSDTLRKQNLFNLTEWVMQWFQKPHNGCLLLQGALDDTEEDDVFQRSDLYHAIDWPVKRSLCNESWCSVLHYDNCVVYHICHISPGLAMNKQWQ